MPPDALEREEKGYEEKMGFSGLPGLSKARRNGWVWQRVVWGLGEERATPVSPIL